MKQDVADKWIANLRTNPPQTENCLFDGKGHCCLGRLVLVLGGSFIEKEVKNSLGDIEKKYVVVSPDGEVGVGYEVLPDWAKEASGMTSCISSYYIHGDDDATCLSSQNDSGVKFVDIAEIINRERNNL